MNKLKNQPAAITGVVVAVITLAVAFGAPISEDQKAHIVGLVGAILALLGTLGYIHPTVDGPETAKAKQAQIEALADQLSQSVPRDAVAVLRDPDTGRFVSGAAHPATDGTPVQLPD